jgi:SAM-dependent methyltransferase
MAEWTSGYVVDVEYTHGFYREQSPTHLAYLCLMQGLQPPGLGGEPLTYCELGCGQGLTTNLLAAANPQIQFYATDFNPSHIDGARSLAQSAKLRNVHFADDSFVEFLDRKDLPEFDFITLHGIYSWISPENRQAIVEFIRRKLKPGGVVYISYNAMPGWSSLMPLRRLLLEHAAGLGARSRAAAISSSLDFAKRLGGLGAKYFAQNPQVMARVEDLTTKDKKYIAHEYFNDNSDPFYFMDVAQELAEAKLTWVGPANALETADELHLTPEQTQLLAEIENVEFRQTVRDHIVNQHFRRDIFVKGPVRLSKAAALEQSLDLRFALTVTSANVPTKVEGVRSAVSINPELHAALVSSFEHGPRSLREALGDPGLSKLTPGELLRGIHYLVGHGSCHPCLPNEGSAERQIQVERFNTAVAEQARHEGKLNYFASSATGSGIHAERITQLIWLAERSGEKDVRRFVWDTLSKAGHRMVKDGQTLVTEDENLAEIGHSVSRFEEQTKPIWRNLGIPVGARAIAAPKEQRLRSA